MDYLDLWKIPTALHNILKDQQIITRFPPEPSGYLHLGHLKAAFINFVLAKKYNGKMIMRFDDTNPAKESCDFENGIAEDLLKVGIYPDTVTHTSDYFEQIIGYADYLINNHLAYVDDTEQIEMANGREKCLDSVNRNNSVDQNVLMWTDMKNGLKNNACVRIKMNMKHKNASCRDPTIFRYLNKEHHNTKDKYKVYPTYDFACPIVDSLEGITHVFRSTEFSDRDEQYNIILKMIKLRKPILFSYGKVSIEGSVMSKRKIKELIDNKIIDGWDDPRLLTLRGMMNKGMHIEPLRQFVASLGFSKNNNNMTEEKLWVLNRKYIDKIATRYTCIPKNNNMEFTIHKIDKHIPFIETKEIPKFIKNPSLGVRELVYSDKVLIAKDDFTDGEQITLMNWGNAYVKNNILELNLEGDFKTTEKKVPWISAKDCILIEINTYCGINNPCIQKYYWGEKPISEINKGDYVQFMKMNHYMCVSKTNSVIRFVEA